MLTQNYLNLVTSFNTQAAITNGFKDISGTTRNIYYTANNLEALTAFKAGSDANKFKFGSGTTAPTVNDYKLENAITSGFSAAYAFSSTDNSVVITITNTSDSAMTISEIGLCESVYYANNSGTMALLYRTVLSSPITIPSGGVGIVKVKVEYDND